MKISTFLAVVTLISSFVIPGKAAFVGSSVTGSLVFSGDPSNYFNPSYGFVPAGYLNASGTTVTISDSAVEFGYDDGVNLLSADFTDNQLTIKDLVELSGANNAFQMIFTDTAFANQYLMPTSTLTLPVTYSLSGDIITLSFPASNVTAGQTLADTFTLAPVPEPSTLGLVFVSMFLAVIADRVLRSRTANLEN